MYLNHPNTVINISSRWAEAFGMRRILGTLAVSNQLAQLRSLGTRFGRGPASLWDSMRQQKPITQNPNQCKGGKYTISIFYCDCLIYLHEFITDTPSKPSCFTLTEYQGMIKFFHQSVAKNKRTVSFNLNSMTKLSRFYSLNS